MKKKAAAATIGIGMAFAAAPLAHADGGWIAEGISDSTGQIQVVYGGTSQAAAEKTVMTACRKNISDCRLLASGQGGCVALATNAANSKYYGGWGPSAGEAEGAALANAKGGTVVQGHTHCQGDPTN